MVRGERPAVHVRASRARRFLFVQDTLGGVVVK